MALKAWLSETLMMMMVFYNNGLKLRNNRSQKSKAREICHVRNSPLPALKMEELCDSQFLWLLRMSLTDSQQEEEELDAVTKRNWIHLTAWMIIPLNLKKEK